MPPGTAAAPEARDAVHAGARTGSASSIALYQLPAPAALFDEQLRLIEANELLSRLLGTGLPILRMRTLSDLLALAEDDPQALFSRIVSLPPERTHSALLPIRDAEGESRRVVARFSRLSQGTRGARVLALFEPAPERIAAGADPLSWYRALFLGSSLPKLLLDERYRIVDANAAALRALGQALGALLWRDPLELVAQESQRTRLIQARAQEEFDTDPLREAGAVVFRLGDGSLRSYDALILRAAAPAAALRLVMLLPAEAAIPPAQPGAHPPAQEAAVAGATAWKDAFVRALRDEQALLPTGGIGAALVENGTIVRATAGFCRFFGLGPQALGLQFLETLVGQKTAAALLQRAEPPGRGAGFGADAAPAVEFVWTSADGLPSSFAATPCVVAEERVLVTVFETSARDDEMSRRLERLALTRDALLRQVHHQTRNVLQQLVNLVQLEASRAPACADTLSRVSSRLMAAAVIEGLRPEEHARAPQPIVQLVERVARTVGRQYEVAIETRADVAPEVAPRALSRHERTGFALAISELLVNAIKHRAAPDDPVRVVIAIGSDSVVVAVSNRGTLEATTEGTRPAGASGTAGAAGAAGASGAATMEAAMEAGGGEGLGLVERMLPGRGSRFELAERDGLVTARVTLTPPAIY